MVKDIIIVIYLSGGEAIASRCDYSKTASCKMSDEDGILKDVLMIYMGQDSWSKKVDRHLFILIYSNNHKQYN